VPAFSNAIVETPNSSACALRVQRFMTAPNCDRVDVSLAGGREHGWLAGYKTAGIPLPACPC
jgi:hypothetical protein